MKKISKVAISYFLGLLKGIGPEGRIEIAEKMIESLQDRIKKWKTLMEELDPNRKPAPPLSEPEEDEEEDEEPEDEEEGLV